GEERGAVDQGVEIEVGAFADQFDGEAIGLADGLAAAEFEYLQVVLETFQGQAEMGFIGRVEHCGSFAGCPKGRQTAMKQTDPTVGSLQNVRHTSCIEGCRQQALV